MDVFADRAEAGELLAGRLLHLRDPVVLALPRGGVAVALPVARRLGGVLDVLVTRKIGYPPMPELGVGAIAEGGEPVLDLPLLTRLGLRPSSVAAVVEQERRELARRGRGYRGERPLPVLAGREVVVVDDGLATGGTARAALRAVNRAGPARVTLAVPVGARETVRALRGEADDVVVLETPADFRAVGQWYVHFDQLSDADVLELLARGRGEPNP
ncbi:phosphoribosyltransferase [Nonomuraea sp. 3-1Str]|uniref:phosphoribosyltransferase n=1 Tax=Nonomuraea sp. 3-1Str TaxID=2929801 RepID=UPI002855B9B2|nr:phosphoribosyltransferase family protein [Nonomuraea sp. 3-1Str]MDR8414869.1 phosphoribosyltransferase [Nonomuraea sp. 3-1Str]